VSNKSRKAPEGKARSASQVAAREHARQLREAGLRRDRRRRMLLTIGAPVLVIVLVVGAFLVIKANQKPPVATGAPSVPAAGALENSIKSIPAATFDTVGKGTGVSPPTVIKGDALTADGKPRVLYIGAEYCPYCAAERWAMVTALSRFGTFAHLGVTSSSSTDVYPSTATLSFHGSTYTSNVLSFTGVEQTTNIPDGSGNYTALDTVAPADGALLTKYDTQQSIPFVDFGNRYMIVGSSYLPDSLKGLTQSQIAAEMLKPDSAVAKNVLGAANMISAVLCRLTNGQPAAVCTSTAVTSQTLPS
jgi:hypothetical protein